MHPDRSRSLVCPRRPPAETGTQKDHPGRCPDHPVGTIQATQRILRDKIEIAAIGIRTDEVKKFWERHRVIHQVKDLPKAMFEIMEGMLVMP